MVFLKDTLDMEARLDMLLPCSSIGLGSLQALPAEMFLPAALPCWEPAHLLNVAWSHFPQQPHAPRRLCHSPRLETACISY